MNGVCRVCELVDNNTTIKEVNYCHLCVAFICSKCEPNILRRAKAMVIQLKLKK